MIRGDKELRARCKALKQEMVEGVKVILEEQSKILTDKVRGRIRSSGEMPSKKLSDYSTKGKHPHRKDREKAGLQVAYKDLTFTGSLLDGLQPKKAEVKKNSTLVSVMSDVSNKKMSGKTGKKKVHTVIVDKLSQQEGLSDGTVIDAFQAELDAAYKPVIDWLTTLIKTKLILA